MATEKQEPEADRFRAGDVWESPSKKQVIVDRVCGYYAQLLYVGSRVLRPRRRHSVKGWKRVSWGGK